MTMKKLKAVHHMWTREEVKKLYKIWDTSSMEEVCEELGIEVGQVRYMVQQMRKHGFPLQKKRKIGDTMLMLKELKAELKIK